MLQLPNVDRPPRGHGLRPGEHACVLPRSPKRRGATWVEIDVKLTADGCARSSCTIHPSKRTTGDRPAGIRDARGPSCRRRRADAWSRRSPAFGELGLGCNVEIKPCEGRAADTAQGDRRDPPSTCGRPRCRRRCCRASRTGRSAYGPTRTAPEFARGTADRRGGGRLVWDAPRRWRPPASTPTASCLTAVRAVEIRKAGYVAQRLHDQRRRRRPGAGRHGRATASSVTRRTSSWQALR
jgi:glycerophosphoryl diester phosphodiesterase